MVRPEGITSTAKAAPPQQAESTTMVENRRKCFIASPDDWFRLQTDTDHLIMITICHTRCLRINICVALLPYPRPATPPQLRQFADRRFQAQAEVGVAKVQAVLGAAQADEVGDFAWAVGLPRVDALGGISPMVAHRLDHRIVDDDPDCGSACNHCN